MSRPRENSEVVSNGMRTYGEGVNRICEMDGWRHWETLGWREFVTRWWWYNLVWWGSGFRWCDFELCSMVVLIKIVLGVWKIMGNDLDGTSEHGEWCQYGRQIVYLLRLFGIGGYPVLLSSLTLLYSKTSYDFETALIVAQLGSAR